MELERNDPGGECGNEVYEMAPVQIGYMLSGQGKGLEFCSNLMENNGKIWGKETFIMCLRALNPLPI